MPISIVPAEDIGADDGSQDIDFSAQMTPPIRRPERHEELDELWDPDVFLPPAEPAPDLPPRGASNMAGFRLDRALALALVEIIFRKGGGEFTTPEVWSLVPKPRPAYRGLSGVGDLLGRGAGKKSFRLWPGAGVYACCRENTIIAARKLTAYELRALAHRLGYLTRSSFEAAIAALPSAQVGTST